MSLSERNFQAHAQNESHYSTTPKKSLSGDSQSKILAPIDRFQYIIHRDLRFEFEFGLGPI